MKKIPAFCLVILVYFNVAAQTTDSSLIFFKKGMDEKALKQYLTASNYFSRAFELNPRYTDAFIENGLANKEMHKTDASMKDFTKALELDPQNDIAIKELMELYFNYRQFQNAIDMAAKCTNCINKDRITALSYYNLEDYGKAEKQLLSIANKNPKDAEVAYTLGRNYLEMGLESKAISWYEKAVLLDDKVAKWHFELGLLYSNTNSYPKAVIAFNKAAEHGFTRSNDFNENLGFAYIYTGDNENGEKLLNELIARKPGDKELLRDIAAAFFDNKVYDNALVYCQKLLEMDMKDGKALYQAGLCFQKKGQVERGMQMCDKAIELDPSLAGLKNKKLSPGM